MNIMNSNYFYNQKSFNSYIAGQDMNFFNVMSVNVRSVSSINKFNLFKNYISQFIKLPDVIAIQETWFSSQYLELYSIGGFNAIHCDRYDGYGGTTLFVNSKLKYRTVFNKSDGNLEVVAVEFPDIKVNNSKLIVITIYRSQRCSINTFLDKMEKIIQELGSSPMLIVGDVNVDLLVNDRSKCLLLDLLNSFGMYTCHDHITRPLSKTSIDWVVSNSPGNFFVHSIENRLSDHNVLSCGIYTNVVLNENTTMLKKIFNYTKFGRILDKSLAYLNRATISSDICEKFMKIMTSAAAQCSTSISQTHNLRWSIAPWTTECLNSIKCYKEKLLRIRRKNKDRRAINEMLKRISKVLKFCNQELMGNYYTNNLRSCQGDLRKTWLFLNEVFGRKQKSTKEIMTEDGNVIIEDNMKATALNHYFVESIKTVSSNIVRLSNDNINLFGTLRTETSNFCLQKVDNAQVEQILNLLEIKKSAGYDNITTKMMHVRLAPVAELLVKIFNNMIENKKYPNVLKIHKITPIPKKPNSKNVADFRPVAVLSVIDKIFEKLIFEQLSNYLHDNCILYEHQFGFKKGSGTGEALVNVLEYICSGFDDGFKGVAGVFFDFSKAFDLVQHNILVEKLKFVGMSNDSICLFEDYLHTRFQYVQVGDSKSNLLPVQHGVPQGSVLGPLLFKIYINDLKNIQFYGKLYMFADDICLFYKYKHETVLKAQIEYDAAILSEFARLNRLVLNSAKTKFIKFRPPKSKNDIQITVHVDGTAIPESKTVKYLGINLSHNLLWDDHIAEVKSKVSAATGVLYKFRNKLNKDIKMLIYQSLIHSRLTYQPLIYGSRVGNSLNSLQSAQNKALKLVYNLPLRFSTFDLYKHKAINVLPIRGLYKQQLLLYVFKSTRSMNSTSLQFNQNIVRTGRETRHAGDLQIVFCRIDITKQRIGFAGPSEYNKLPVSLKNLSSISTFKQNLRSYLLENLETLL